MSAAAKTTLYAFNTHERWASETSTNDALMLGKAMLTIVTSRKLMNAAAEATRRICQRLSINPPFSLA
jgi:hypothetical protein